MEAARSNMAMLEYATAITAPKSESATPVSEEAPGSREWSQRVRSEAKQVVGQLNDHYMRLAKLLYEIKDTPLAGNPDNLPAWRSWGYSSFEEYAWNELGLRAKRAKDFCRMWLTLEVQSTHLPSEIKQRIVALGVSAALVLTQMLRLSNDPKWIKEWVDFAEDNPVNHLQATAASAQIAYRERPLGVTTMVGPEEIALNSPPKRRLTDGKPVYDVPANDAEETSEDEEVAYIPVDPRNAAFLPEAHQDTPVADLPSTETQIRDHFAFSHEQYEVVKQALTRASQLSNSDVKSHNFTLICMDFLATNEFTKPGPAQLSDFLTKLETTLGVKLVCLDPENKQILHGNDALVNLSTWFD